MVGGERGWQAQDPRLRLAAVTQLWSRLLWAPSSTAWGLPAGHTEGLSVLAAVRLPPTAFGVVSLEQTGGPGGRDAQCWAPNRRSVMFTERSTVTRGCEHRPLLSPFAL